MKTSQLPPIAELIRQGALISFVDGILLAWGTCQAGREAREVSFYVNDFFLREEAPWKNFENYSFLSWQDWESYQMQMPHALQAKIKWQLPERLDFFSAMANLKENYFSEGLLDKAVPVTFAVGKGEPPQNLVAHLLRQLKRPLDSLFYYGYWNDKEGIWGLTPEILFQGNGHYSALRENIKTMALAGTAAPGPTAAADLLESDKDRREHQVVVEDIATRLQELGEVRLGRTEVWQLPHLLHLRTPIEIDSEVPLQFEKLVHTLHPTAALGAFPRLQGWQWLESQEQKMPRHRFGAPFGVAFKDRNTCLVAIRNVQWQVTEDRMNRIYLGTGCGVVSESDSQKEWDELALKRQSVMRTLNL